MKMDLILFDSICLIAVPSFGGRVPDTALHVWHVLPFKYCLKTNPKISNPRSGPYCFPTAIFTMTRLKMCRNSGKLLIFTYTSPVSPDSRIHPCVYLLISLDSSDKSHTHCPRA